MYGKNNNRAGLTCVRPKMQIVGGKDTTPPNVPGGARFIPRRDRETIAHAFYALGRSVQWLSRTNRLPHREIEVIIRNEHESRLNRIEALFAGRCAA
jgi:hypothetical protein